MSDVIDFSNEDEHSPSAGILGKSTTIDALQNNVEPKEKRLGQLTFEDFEHIEHVDTSPDMSGHALGLRRSKRVHQPKPRRDPDELAEEEAAAAARDRRSKAALKAKAKAKEREKIAKEKEKQRVAALKKAAKEDARKGSTNSAKKSVPPGAEPPVPTLTTGNWTPNMPLLSSDYKTHHSIISRLKNPNMKPIPYAGTIIKLMSFINKFSLYFAKDLLSLSFQDFEVGLDLYPGDPFGTVPGNNEPSTQRTILYQDFIPIKDVVSAQDKMNLLFLTLLKLTFSTSKSSEIQKTHHPHATMSQLQSSKKIFASLMKQLRAKAKEWGYPKEWRSNSVGREEFVKPKSQIFEQDETDNPVDPKNPSILTKNIYIWNYHEPLSGELDPLENSDLDRNGILALEPHDRVILFKSLIDWCGAQSPQIRNEIYHLSHPKRDPSFGIQTQHAPRYMVEGSSVTLAQFRKLCSMVQTKYEIRSRKKHVKKQLESGKRQDLRIKFDSLKEIKAELKKATKEEKDEVLYSLYDKWCRLFDGEIQDNPLSDPFEDELYKLRQQEFFIGRVPQIGDFYLPRLHTYPSSPVVSTYRDLRSLKDLLRSYADGEIDVFTLFEHHGQEMSSQFKLLYHDAPSVIRDTTQDKITPGKNYWFEMCCDTKTLKEFLDFLEYKIAPGEPSKEQDQKATHEEGTNGVEEAKEEIEAKHKEPHKEPLANGSGKENEKASSDANTTSIINRNPLPKESRFNASRTKLAFLKDFLTEMLPVLEAFEQLKEQYAGMKPGKRLLRRAQTRSINYSSNYDSEHENIEGDTGDEYVDDEDSKQTSEDPEEEDNEYDSAEDDDHELRLKRARVERTDARTARRNARR